MNLPIAFPNKKQLQDSQLILAVDVGATKTHLAFFQSKENKIELLREAKFPSKAYRSFVEILEIFRWNEPLPDVLCIAFAGPVMRGRTQATNLSWHIYIKVLKNQLNFDAIFLINDLQAHAYGLSTLEEQETQTIHIGNPLLKGNAAIIAPGTGLGEAGLFWDGNSLHPFATEGGHAGFAPRDAIDDELLHSLRQQYGHVSWERLVSGPGISYIYEFLRKKNGVAEPDWFTEQCQSATPAEAVSNGARKGDSLCKEAMTLFFKYLAMEAANLAVKFNATGGIFIGGGVVPKNLDLFDIIAFQDFFYDKGRLRPLLEQVPVYILLNQNTALEGAAYYAANASVTTLQNLTP